MSRWMRVAYNGAFVPLARLALPVAARKSAKLRHGLEVRRGLANRWRDRVAALQGRSPRVWFHASSAGETLQARPLVDAVRRALPEAALFYSYFSSSAEPYVANWASPDASDYLPFDARRPINHLLDTLRPDALVLVGGELWPNLVWNATDRGVLVAQICCRIARRRGRVAVPGRWLAAELYGRMRAIGAVADEDAAALVDLGVSASAIQITGDTRVDATLERVADRGSEAVAVGDSATGEHVAGAPTTVVAGSVWPADVAIVIPAVARLRARFPELVAIVAPHEPTATLLSTIETAAERHGLDTARWSGPSHPLDPQKPIVLVDRVGVLYRLYAGAAAAYVGGGFSGAVHNTMEPAAWSVPIAVGPEHGSPNEVLELRDAGALVETSSVSALVSAWGAWLADREETASPGAAGRAVLDRHAGATRRTLDHLLNRGLPVG